MGKHSKSKIEIKKDKKEKKQHNRKNNKKILSKIIIIFQIIFLGVIIFSIIEIYQWYKENKSNNEIAKQLSSFVTINNEKEENDKDKYNIDFKALKQQNSDTVAWIKVTNSYLQYPVVKADDNSYYLTHSFDKTYNSAGWIFADYKNRLDGTDKNIVIFGHNRRDGSMFGTLKNVLDESWYNNETNMEIIFVTEDNNYKYRIFSIYQILKEDYYIQTEFEDTEFAKFIKEIKERSIKNFNEEVSDQDTILTLSTCANNNKYRIVLHAKKIE